MNVDIENLEKRKKIVIICLSGALIFITLIAGLFIIKNPREVVNENNDNDKVNKKDNEEAITNEDDYFFYKKSSQITENVLLSIVTGILLFFWENDKFPPQKEDLLNKEVLGAVICGKNDVDTVGVWIFEKANWFGFATLASFIVIALLVEFIFNHLLIGSIAHLFSKDKSKKYFHTLKKSWKKRMQFFSSFTKFTKIKILSLIFTYLICAFIIAMAARIVDYHCGICCCRENGEIIHDHGKTCCCGFGEVKKESDSLENPYFLFEDPSLKNGSQPNTQPSFLQGKKRGEPPELMNQPLGGGGGGGDNQPPVKGFKFLNPNKI